MPYVLFASQQAEGEQPKGSRYERNSDYVAQPGEVVFSDVEFESKSLNGVWDAASQSVRVRTTADTLALRKREKRQGLLIAFKADYAAIWLIDGIAVEEQKDSILAKTAAQRTANETALVNQAGTLITKIKTKFADVNNATTEAQVQAITWA